MNDEQKLHELVSMEVIPSMEAMQEEIARHRKVIMEIWGLRAEGVDVPKEVLDITRKYWNANCGPFDRSVQAMIDTLKNYKDVK